MHKLYCTFFGLEFYPIFFQFATYFCYFLEYKAPFLSIFCQFWSVFFYVHCFALFCTLLAHFRSNLFKNQAIFCGTLCRWNFLMKSGPKMFLEPLRNAPFCSFLRLHILNMQMNDKVLHLSFHTYQFKVTKNSVHLGKRLDNWVRKTSSSHAWVKAVNMTHAPSLFKKDLNFLLMEKQQKKCKNDLFFSSIDDTNLKNRSIAIKYYFSFIFWLILW